MRTAEVVANEKWIVWLNTLDPTMHEAVMRDELFYFDEFIAERMSIYEILAYASRSTYSYA